MAFNVTLGCLASSVKYRRRRDGKARNSKIKAGRIVQTTSISSVFDRNRVVCLLVKITRKAYEIRDITRVRMINV